MSDLPFSSALVFSINLNKKSTFCLFRLRGGAAGRAGLVRANGCLTCVYVLGEVRLD